MNEGRGGMREGRWEEEEEEEEEEVWWWGWRGVDGREGGGRGEGREDGSGGGV